MIKMVNMKEYNMEEQTSFYCMKMYNILSIGILYENYII